MKAVSIDRYGGVEVLSLTDTPIPSPGKSEILVKVHACGLNPVDYKIRGGYLKNLFAVTFPRILGGDISGTVAAIGNDVGDFSVGDEVFFSNPLDKNGGYSEYCSVDQQFVSFKPKSLTHNEAATLPVAGLTSIQALRNFSKIRSGHKVLIHAGAGGVGSFAIQYAKQMGAIVFATASRPNHNYVKKLRADIVINYLEEDFVSICQNAGGMDIVLESVGGSNYYRSILATRDGGFVPCIVNTPDEKTKSLAHQRAITTDFLLLSCCRADLLEIAKLVDAKIVRPPELQVLSFDQIAEGHRQLESGKGRGKLVLQVMRPRYQ